MMYLDRLTFARQLKMSSSMKATSYKDRFVTQKSRQEYSVKAFNNSTSYARTIAKLINVERKTVAVDQRLQELNQQCLRREA